MTYRLVVREGQSVNISLSQLEYDAIINAETKVIAGNISWEGNQNSLARIFRVDIGSSEGYPIFVDGW